jgi:hypothetical protein
MKKTAAEIARGALEILDRDGWCKFFVTAPDPERYPVWTTGARAGQHCVGGAWNLAHHRSDMWDTNDLTYLVPLVAEIRAQYPEMVAGAPQEWGGMFPPVVAYWNNHDDVTEDDVRRVLEKIAAGETR